MDPKAALEWTENALARGDRELAAEYLDGYWEWRRKGGFEPADGDNRARALALDIWLRAGHVTMRCSACDGTGRLHQKGPLRRELFQRLCKGFTPGHVEEDLKASIAASLSKTEPKMPDLHGMSPARYIEILERTIRDLRSQNEDCTKRIAELMDRADAHAKVFHNSSRADLP